MSDSNNSKRKVQVKLDRKFGFVDDTDRPVTRSANPDEVVEENPSVRFLMVVGATRPAISCLLRKRLCGVHQRHL